MTRFRTAIRTKRRKAAVVVALLAFVPATAFAYFALHGAAPIFNANGGSTAASGGTADWAITVGPPSGPALVPGGAGDTFAVTVTNTNSVAQTGNDANLTAGPAGHAAIAIDYNGYTDIPGCEQAWFVATVNGATGHTVTVPAGGTLNAASGDTLTVTLTMPADSLDDQSACEGHAIDVALNFSS
ncbi:MAG: hypothetical protein ACYDCS_02315 [Candidatus Dormibacteria bacterium]